MSRYTNRKVKSRMLAFQAIYQWQATGETLSNIKTEFVLKEHNFSKVFFSQLLVGVAEHCNEIDEKLQLNLDRPLNQLDLVERAILRLASFELLHCPETPTKVIINEAITLAKEFAGDKSHKYINAILDKLAKSQPRTQKVFSGL